MNLLLGFIHPGLRLLKLLLVVITGSHLKALQKYPTYWILNDALSRYGSAQVQELRYVVVGTVGRSGEMKFGVRAHLVR